MAWLTAVQEMENYDIQQMISLRTLQEMWDLAWKPLGYNLVAVYYYNFYMQTTDARSLENAARKTRHNPAIAMPWV